MSFLQTRLRDLTEPDLLALIGLPEGLQLEFKQELNLVSQKERREAAKDISALANTVGGRVVYGMKEDTLPDGQTVAKEISPLIDGALPERLSNILNSLLLPTIRFDMHTVRVAGGYVLAVEVPTSTGLDLHMVCDSEGGRFYMRGPTGNVPMLEPEIRNAYVRIAERRASLDARVEATMGAERRKRGDVDCSFFVVPVHSRRNLVDPRRSPTLGLDLYRGALGEFELRDVVSELGIVHDGFRYESGAPAPGWPSSLYLAILKSGLIHWSRVRLEPPDGKSQPIASMEIVMNTLPVMVLARSVLRTAGYLGDVRLRYIMNRPRPWKLDPGLFEARKVPPGLYESEVETFDLESGPESWGTAIKELLDPFFHAAGVQANPYFSPLGLVRLRHAKSFSEFGKHLRIEEAPSSAS